MSQTVKLAKKSKVSAVEDESADDTTSSPPNVQSAEAAEDIILPKSQQTQLSEKPRSQKAAKSEGEEAVEQSQQTKLSQKATDDNPFRLTNSPGNDEASKAAANPFKLLNSPTNGPRNGQPAQAENPLEIVAPELKQGDENPFKLTHSPPLNDNPRASSQQSQPKKALSLNQPSCTEKNPRASSQHHSQPQKLTLKALLDESDEDEIPLKQDSHKREIGAITLRPASKTNDDAQNLFARLYEKAQEQQDESISEDSEEDSIEESIEESQQSLQQERKVDEDQEPRELIVQEKSQTKVEMSGRTSSISPNDQMYEDGGVDSEEALGDDISTDDMVIDTWSRHHCIDPAQAKENQRKCKKLLKKQLKKEQKKLLKEQLKVQAERRQGSVFRITTIVNGKKISRGGAVAIPEKGTTLPGKTEDGTADKPEKTDKADKKRLKKEKKEKKRRLKAMRKMGEAPAPTTAKRQTTMVTRRRGKQQSIDEVEEEIEIPLDEIEAEMEQIDQEIADFESLEAEIEEYEAEVEEEQFSKDDGDDQSIDITLEHQDQQKTTPT